MARCLGRVVRVVVAEVGAGLRETARAVGGVLGAVLVPIGRFMGRVGRQVGRHVWAGCTTVGRAVAMCTVAAYRSMRRTLKAWHAWSKRHLLDPLGRAFQWAARTAIVPLLRRLSGAGRKAWLVSQVAAGGMVAVGRAVAGGVMRLIPVAQVQGALEVLQALPSTLTQSARIAVGTARHRAAGVASPGLRGRAHWQAAATGPARPDGAGVSTFSIEVDHNSCLAPGHNRITAVLSVTCDEAGRRRLLMLLR
jgi:hypothetical protein